MNFQEGYYLYGGVAAALLAGGVGFWSVLKNKRLLAAYSQIHHQLSSARGQGLSLLRVLLMMAAVVSLALALAGPEAEGPAEVMQNRMDMVFAVDLSRSMLAVEGKSTRLDRVKQEIRGFLPHARGQRLGLVAFAGSAQLLCPLTRDLESFSLFLDRLDPFAMPEGGTSLGRGLSLAMDTLQWGSEKTEDRASSMSGPSSFTGDSLIGDCHSFLILFSDGENLERSPSPVGVAEEAARGGMRVFTVLMGTGAGAKIPDPDRAGFLHDGEGAEVVSVPDPGLMEAIAAAGKGAFAAAQEIAFPLEYLYQEQLTGLAQQVALEDRSSGREAAFQGFLALGLIFLLAELFLPLRKSTRALGTLCLLAVLCAPQLGWEDDGADEQAAVPDQVGREEDEPGDQATVPVEMNAAPVQMNPDSAGPLALAAYRAGRYGEALAAFEAAAQDRDPHGGLLMNLGLTYLRLHDPDQALSFFRQARATGEVACRLPATFAEGMALYRMAEKAWLSESMEAGFDFIRKGRASFVECLIKGFYPAEAGANLELANRLMEKLEKELEKNGPGEEVAGDPGDEEGAQGESGAREGEGQGSEEVGSAQGKEGDSSQADPVRMAEEMEEITAEERARIFALLAEMERERMALEQEAVKGSRMKSGGRDW